MRFPALILLLPTVAVAQAPPELAAERADFARWLQTAPGSPFAAIYHQPFADDLVFGPGGEPGLEGLPSATLSQGLLRLSLESADGSRGVPRNRDVSLGAEWRLRVTGDRGRSVVTVFGPVREPKIPGWYAYDSTVVVEGTLEPPPKRASRRMLGLDGVEVEGSHAGTWVGHVADQDVRLTVYRMPEPGTAEADLMIFFRDATNGRGTYPAGRFLALRPQGGNRYRADFNRARNPFCAYNGIFPCPAQWPGNAIDSAVEAGERYLSP
ncbi:MAG: DUF1684 domain-containing protein [Gemmatimonadota bacterium]|nr:DUF1684 domain-containing protein [Gemmatimonadota bacterium]MDH5196016.1 DUF1684 domain-containing protein [Gemmatimonadota bacterium]